ncbi:glycosyltransferase family 39 protein [Streptomyces sp. NPDC087512]|uniref:glycosyltransferase family 39 protein n=1 Tax=Streptomyces sp. NPDC087512 TaxID=3155059 RepID=UPI003431544C
MSSTASGTTPSGHVPATRRPRSRSRRAPAPPPRTRATTDARTRRLLRAAHRAAPALGAYLAVRGTSLLVLAVWAPRRHQDLWVNLAAQWDSDWYLGIAEHGYTDELGTDLNANNLAFFPLYPVLVKAVAVLTPGSRASTGLGVAVAASLVAAWGIFAVGDRLYGRRAGVLLTTLWAAFPVGVVQWMGYTESLFTACAAWSLYAVLSGRWLWAAACAVLAGLTRPTGVAVAAAVTLTALAHVVRRREPHPRLLAAALLAPLGWCGYVGWVGLRLGRWDGYFAVQRLWHNELDGGLRTLHQLCWLLWSEPTPPLFLVMVTLTLIASVMLFGLSVSDRQPLPLLVFTGVLLVIVLGSGGVYFPRARFLLPAFPLLLPLALHLSRASARHRALALAAAVLTSSYCGAYMLLVWPAAP